jgi:hypothetical protein
LHEFNIKYCKKDEKNDSNPASGQQYSIGEGNPILGEYEVLIIKRCIGIELTEVGYLTVRCTQEGDSGTNFPSNS